MARHCMHASEQLKRKPSPRTLVCFEELPQYAPRLARYDETGLFSALREYQGQSPAKSGELLCQIVQELSF